MQAWVTLGAFSLAGAGFVQAYHAAVILWIARALRRAQHAPVTLKWDPGFELPSRTFWHSHVG